MKQIRWWNSFNLLGVILLIIGVAGVALGSKMVFDPGRPKHDFDWALYLTAGVLMLINGFLPPATLPQASKPKKNS